MLKYSVIIPCYNERDNMEALLKRIIKLQSEFNLEYILVENGSLDGSAEYFKTYIENKYQNIKVVYVIHNQGYGFGLQQGLKVASGKFVGWIPADMQIRPEELIPFFSFLEKTDKENLFLKGNRKNRPLFDRTFTFVQGVINSILFQQCVYDIGATPVVFSSSLLKKFSIDEMPNDFAIELYVYLKAKEYNYKIERFPVELKRRERGKSSWDKGLKTKIRMSRRSFHDSCQIKRGKKVY